LVKLFPVWWFGAFFIFPYTGNKHPNCLISFRGVAQPPTRNVFFLLTTSPFFGPFCGFHQSPQVFLKDTLDAAQNDAENLVVERLRKKDTGYDGTGESYGIIFKIISR